MIKNHIKMINLWIIYYYLRKCITSKYKYKTWLNSIAKKNAIGYNDISKAYNDEE